MITLGYWQLGILVIVGMFALAHMYTRGKNSGQTEVAKFTARQTFDLTIHFLERDGIIKTSNNRVYPGDLDVGRIESVIMKIDDDNLVKELFDSLSVIVDSEPPND